MDQPDEVFEVLDCDVPASPEAGLCRDIIMAVRKGLSTETITIALRYADEENFV